MMMLSEEFKICKDTATQFMDIAKNIGEIPANIN